MTNKLLLHNGSWLLIDVKAEIKNNEWFLHVIHEGQHNESKILAKMIDIKYDLFDEIFLAVELDGTNFTSGFHKQYPILASQTKLEGIPLLLRENVDEKLKKAREMKQRQMAWDSLKKHLVPECFNDEYYFDEHFKNLKSEIQNAMIEFASLSSGKEFDRENMKKFIHYTNLLTYKRGKWHGERGEEYTAEELLNKFISSLTPQQDMEAEYEMDLQPKHEQQVCIITKIILK